MPARFVEVVDGVAEASSTLAQLLASGRGLVGTLSFNASDYLNATSSDALLDALRAYNLTLDWNAYWSDGGALGALVRSLNITDPEVPAPAGPARHLLLVGASLLVSRELYVAVRARRVLRQYGMRV